MTLLIGALTIGLILSLLALGVFISFRIFEFPDITADGSITLGAALAAVLLVHGVHPVLATAAALAGRRAGRHAHRRHPHTVRDQQAALRHPGDDRALLHQPARHGQEQRAAALGAHAGHAGGARRGARPRGSTPISTSGAGASALRDAAMLLVAACWWCWPSRMLLYAFFRTNLGTAMQAAGDNPQMIRALGVNVDNMIVLGLALSNGLIALSGALLAQYQGFADVQMGIGMVVWGLASIIIGEALVGVRQLGLHHHRARCSARCSSGCSSPSRCGAASTRTTSSW